MEKGLQTRKLLWATGLLVGLGAVTPVLASPIEHGIDTTGQVGVVPLAYGEHTLNAALATSLEVDRFSFAGLAGDQMRLLFHTLSGGLDPFVALRDPTGAVINSVSCNGNDGFGRPILCSSGFDQTLASSGLYTINVSDIGADDAGSYQLHLERYPPVNNWLGFQYSANVDAELGHTTDMDFFAFDGVAATEIRLTLRTTTGGTDPVLEVWDPSGTRISNTLCSGNDGFGRPILCTNSIDLSLASSGVYRIGVSDSGWDETGSYRFEVNCLFGACPSPLAPAPVPVPEPAAQALLIAGLGLLGWLGRRRKNA